MQAAIQALGFRPNPVARGLAGGRTLSVGVVTQIISSPFYGEALLGARKFFLHDKNVVRKRKRLVAKNAHMA